MTGRFALALAIACCLTSTACKDRRYTEVTLRKDFKPVGASITLPDAFKETFPAGPGAEAMDNNCRTCHSPSMVLVQPPLKHDEWAKEIDKMIKVYKAPVNAADLPAIAAYLDALSAKQAASLTPGSDAGSAKGK